MVLAGMGLIFGTRAPSGAAFITLGRFAATFYTASGVVLLVISQVMIWRMIRNHANRKWDNKEAVPD